MVKKFISGLLKKKNKEEAEEPTGSENVPEELPPLAEDVVEKAEEQKEKVEQTEEKEPETEKETKISDEIQEPPEELPSLDIGESQEESGESQIEDLFKEEKKEELPEEIKKAKAAKAGLNGTSKGQSKTIEEKKDSILKEKVKTQPEVGFFSSILEHIDKHEGSKEKLLAGDLFDRMSNYWELKKHEIKTGSSLSTEKKLEEDLKHQIVQLKILEQKWQVQKLALGEDIKFLHEREREIQTNIEELKRISNELNLFKNVKPEEYFHLHNGVVLKSLHDLIDALEIIDDETFNHHVNKEKNDFSDWIKQVIKDKNLAEKIRKAKKKEKIIEILETEPVIMETLKTKYKGQLPPRKYFQLANGIIIKSLYELLDALKNMDDELFERHVTEGKNDFSSWIKATLKNDDLADRLSKARSKKEMVDVLEVFL